AESRIVSAIGVLEVCIVRRAEAVAGAAIDPPVIHAILEPDAAHSFDGISITGLAIIADTSAHFAISLKISGAECATVIGFTPAIVVGIGAPSVTSVPFAVAEAFAKSLPVIAIEILHLDQCLGDRPGCTCAQHRCPQNHRSHRRPTHTILQAIPHQLLIEALTPYDFPLP